MARFDPILEVKEPHHEGTTHFYRYALDKNKVWFTQDAFDGHIYAACVVERPEIQGVRLKIDCGKETPMYPKSISYDKDGLDKTQIKYCDLLIPAVLSIFDLPEHRNQYKVNYSALKYRACEES